MEAQEEQKSLKYFLKQLKRYGKHKKVEKLYGKETQPSDIIVGEVHSVAETAEKPNRKLVVTVLREVYPDGSKGKLFSLFAFFKYANILESNSCAAGSIIAICGADIDKSHFTDDNDHDHLPYRARLGLPKKNGSKFIFMMNSHSKDKETLPKIQRQNKSKQSSGSSRTKQNTSQSSQVKSKGPNIAAASKSKPEQKSSHTTSSAVEVPERSQRQRPAETINRYHYSKLCDLKMAATKLNAYGVISRLLRMRDNYAHLDLVDETLPADQTFKLHIFKGPAPCLPNITEGHIIRAHRLKTEEFQEQWDGRVFDARDIVIFPPEGNGKEDAVTVSKNFHFEDADLERLEQLRQWIKEEYSRRPSSPTPTSREGSVSGEDTAGGYNSSVKTLAEIQNEGHYILYCKVLESHHKKGKTVLIVTDGTIPSHLREQARSADTRNRRLEDSRTVKVILKSETQMKLQDEFVKMIGLEAETVVDAYSEKTCLAFVLRKIQNIKMIPPTHNQAKLISRRLQLAKKDANRSASAEVTATSERVLNGQEIESDSNSRTRHDVSGLNGMSQNRKRRINSRSRESEIRELERNSGEAGNTSVQQRRRPSLSEEIPEIKHQHRWHDPQGQSLVTPLETETSRDNRNEIQGALFSTSTPMKNSDEPNSDEENGKCEDIISLLYNFPEERNAPGNTQERRCEQVDSTRRAPILLTEEKQSSSSDCEIVSASKQLRKVPLVPRANSKDGSELLKSLKQKARKRVYGDGCTNLDHNLDCSNNTIYDDGVQAVPNQMSDEKSQSQCLECSCLGTAEMMANMHQCLARIARVEPVTRDQENLQPEHVEVEQLADSQEPSPSESEHYNHHRNFGPVNLNKSFNDSEQGDNSLHEDVTLIMEDDPVTPVAGPSTYRDDVRERVLQSRASRDVDSGTSDDEDSETSSTCVYIAQNKSSLGKRVAENCSDEDVDRQRKYPKISSAESVRDLQNENNSDDQKSTVSESSVSVASHWTEVHDSADENPLPVTIRCIKSRGLEENEYLVEGVVTQIEPCIRAGNLRKDFVSGYCSTCNAFSRYSSLIPLEGNSQERTCPQCPDGRRRPVSLVFTLKFRIVDKTNEELEVGLCGESGVDFFGVTVNRYLRDPQIRRQIADALQDLLPTNDARRETRKVRLYVQSFLDLRGMQYMIRKTYLCFTHGRV